MSTEKLNNGAEWLVLQDGRMGTDGQGIGLAHAMGSPYVTHSITLSWWQRLLPPDWMAGLLAPFLFRKRPRPAGLIGAGRRASYALLAARAVWPGIPVIQIQNPHVNPAAFTYVIAPQHDVLSGPNVISILGGLHAVTDEKLNAARVEWQPRLENYAAPRVAVLIGGNNKYVTLDEKWVDDLATTLSTLHAAGHALWITASRRTPPALAARLRAALPAENVFFWDGNGENPYLGFLSLADFILVTSDSVSMISEALYTDKPVALLRMPGAGGKFAQFHNAIIKGGYTHWFNGNWEVTQRPRLDEASRAAKSLLQ